MVLPKSDSLAACDIALFEYNSSEWSTEARDLDYEKFNEKNEGTKVEIWTRT